MNENNKYAERESLGILANIFWFFSVVGTIIAWAVWLFFLLIVGIFERIWHVQNVRRIDKEKFWINVGKCLVEFHGMTSERAVDLVNKHKHDCTMMYLRMPAFYYKQPFKVANDIAGCEPQISLEEYRERYLKKILEQ